MFLRILISILIILALHLPALPAKKELTVHHLANSSGLINNLVTSLYKDSKGFLWIGTPTGLYRYTGYSAQRIADDSQGEELNIVNAYIYDISEDALGRLWIHADQGFGIYDPDSERVVGYVDDYLKQRGYEGHISTLKTDAKGDVWIAMDGVGLIRLRLPEDTVEVVKGDAFAKGSFTDLEVYDGKIIGITDRALIAGADPERMSSVVLDPGFNDNATPGTQTLYLDRNKRLWILSTDQLRLFDPSARKWLTSLLPDEGNVGVVKALYHDSKGNLWIARDHHGIESVAERNGRLTFEPVKVSGDFNPDNTVTAILEDEHGTIWFGTYKLGLYSHNDSVDKFSLEQFPDVNCMVMGRNGDIWVGTDNSGLWHWNLESGERRAIADPADSGSPKAITALATSPDGTVYIGAFSRGLRTYKDGRFTRLSTGSDLDHSFPWSFCFDRSGDLWVGTLGGGLFRYSPSDVSVVSFQGANGISSDYVINVLASRDGKIYCGTSGGVDCYDPATGRLSPLRIGDSTLLENIKVVQLFEDSRGLLWVATSTGLKAVDRQRGVVHDVAADSSPSESYILGITEDNGGGMWVSDGSRIVNLKISYDDQTGSFSTSRREYDSRDGLQDCDFNQRSFLKLPDGDIAVGGLYGINRFSPSDMRYNTSHPRVMFTDLYMGNLPVKVGEKIDGRVVMRHTLSSGERIEFSHNPKEFTIYFASDNYALPEKTRFLYRLEGYNDQWLECPEGVNHVTYTNLSPGNYRLMVKAINGDGYESEAPAVLPIKVYTSFWGSVWAWIIYVVVAAGVIWGIVKITKSHERRLLERRHHEDEMRKREELNQMKFRFFTNVSHDLRTPLTLIVSPLEEMIKESDDERQTKRLTMMRNNAMRLLSLVNQLLDFRKNEVTGLQLNASEGDIVVFARNVCNSFMNLSDRKNINLTFYSDRERIELMFDGDKMEKVFMNLLGNAFKFTPAGGRIDVALEHVGEENPVLRIKISDTGIGIKDKDKEHIFERFYQVDDQGDSHPGMGSGIGLSMVSEYVKLHDGTIRVTDNVERGSVFIIDIPIKLSDKPAGQPASDSSLAASTAAENGETEKDETPMDGERKTVLVVDDNPDMTEMLKDSLEEEYNVLTADDGNEALAVVAQTKPDIILTDLMMPGMNGIELCRRLKSDKATVAIPLVIITAKHDLGVKLEGLTLGADDYITKPFNLDVLRLRMRRLVALTAKGAGRSLIEPEPEHIEITPLDEKLIEKAMKYVSDNIDSSELSVEELSAALGMSRVRLYKKIKQITGKTPIEFIRVIRLKRAAQLLRESQLNVSEIAYQTGFNNPKMFSRYFKEEFGILPSAYQDKEGKETNYTI